MPKLPFPPFSPEILTDLSQQISKLLPGEKSREEIQRSIHLLLQNALSQLDLVSRDEFDIQAAVLQKTRAKLEELEEKLNQLSQ